MDTLLAHRVIVLADRSRRLVPFWQDQELVCSSLARWFRERGLVARACPQATDPWFALTRPSFDAKSADPTDSGASPARPGPRAARVDLPGAVVLVLGDLGAYAGSGEQERWAGFAEQVDRAGAELRALVPCPPWRTAHSLGRRFHAAPWDPRERDLHPLTDAERDERAERLLVMVSPAIRVELGLLRAVRSLLPAHATDSGTEVDACSHSAVSSPSSAALTLDSDALGRLRPRFLGERHIVQRALVELLRQWHASLPEEILVEELFSLALHAPELFADARSRDDVQAWRRYLEQAAGAFDVENGEAGRGVPDSATAWFRRFASRVPEQAWLDSVGDALRRAWVLVCARDPEAKAPPGVGPNDLASVERGVAHTARRLGLWQLGSTLALAPREAEDARSQTEQGRAPRQRQAGSLLGEVTLGRPKVVVGPLGQRGQQYDLSARAVLSCALPWSEAFSVTTDEEQLVLRAIEKPSWAARAGRDRYGLYADADIVGVTQRMRWIGPGRFMMGSPPDEAERYEDEQLHEVELTEGYWLADTACTQALWQAVMKKNPANFKKGQDAAQRPVENVSWEDCQAFFKTVRARTDGLDFRLPTEAEWECACRVGTTTPFAFGKNITPDQVNCNGNYPYAGGPKGLYRETNVPVKNFEPNAWGLYQMHGNVIEWCSDWFGEYKGERAVNPQGPPKGTDRVLRGGSWFDFARRCRSAYRPVGVPADRFGLVGFRFARGQDAGKLGKQTSEPEEAGRRGTRRASRRERAREQGAVG